MFSFGAVFILYLLLYIWVLFRILPRSILLSKLFSLVAYTSVLLSIVYSEKFTLFILLLYTSDLESKLLYSLFFL